MRELAYTINTFRVVTEVQGGYCDLCGDVVTMCVDTLKGGYICLVCVNAMSKVVKMNVSGRGVIRDQ